jgi:23S rRNA (uracil1939-C5)-methyltransferase/tRNA (uracil-5-)-methyltransferase
MLLLRDSDGAVETNHATCVNAMENGLVFKFQASNFFQNKPHMLDLMVDLVVDAATWASPTTGRTMTHLMCIGIEVNKVAISEARENTASNGIRNCDFVDESAQAIFSSKVPVSASSAIYDGGGEEDGSDNDEKKSGGLLVWDFLRDTMVVVVDPPRKGCSVEFFDQLNKY